MTNRRRHSGFTLTELMVALAVMIIVASQVMLSYTNQHEKSQSHERVVESQEEVRLITDVILNDLRMAGFMVHETAGVGSGDGGTTGSDTICVSDPNRIAAARVAVSNSRFTGAELSSALSTSASTLNFTSSVPSTMDIDADGNNDFIAGEGVLISGGDEVHCARIVTVGTNTLDFTPPTPSTGFSIAASEAIVVPALVYQLNGTQLTRNGVVLTNQVEDLQIEFGVDADNNGLIENAEFPIHDLNGQDLTRVRTARLHVTGRTARSEPDFVGGFAAVANRNAGAADNFKRRRVTADAMLRNLR